ncbi:hypothetical protein GGR10_000548 [Bartonella chomelii]|uniref:Uncharacterized protein n=1 Tax=Bartonella chomelii TaxID=236402 RepID=A0ABR6E2C9_9HYPH|nr:hypothetical protein [Bartonella chomelii]MBA9082707.1 hypothetical protein [Bartonella chomelii]
MLVVGGGCLKVCQWEVRGRGQGGEGEDLALSSKGIFFGKWLFYGGFRGRLRRAISGKNVAKRGGRQIALVEERG